MKNIFKRIFALSLVFLFLVGVVPINNFVFASPNYFSPNTSATLPANERGNVREWTSAVGNGAVRPFSNNSYVVEEDRDKYQFQLKRTSNTTLTVTKGTSIAPPTSVGSKNGSPYNLNLSEDAKTNYKWFRIKYDRPDPGTSNWRIVTENTVNNIQVKVSNLRIYQVDDNGENGKWLNIDLVRTITDMYIFTPDSYSYGATRMGYDGNANYVALGYGVCDTYYIGLNNVKTTNQFYLAGTNTPVNIKTNITCYDVDADQTISFKNGNIVRHYLTSNTTLYYDKRVSDSYGRKQYNSPATEYNGQIYSNTTIGFLLNGSSLEYTFGRAGSHSMYATMQEQFIGTLSNMRGFTPVNPTKSITDNDEVEVKSNNIRSIGESWTYNIDQTFPELNASEFSSFRMRDYIDGCLNVDEGNIKLEATDGINIIDVSSWFDISFYRSTSDLGAHRVDVVLKDSYINSLSSPFYNYQTYRLKIPVKLNGSTNSSASGSFISKMSRHNHLSSENNKILTFKNSAYSYINDEQRTTNEVETTVHLPNLNITKVADRFEYQVGDTIHYTVEVNNTNTFADTTYFTIYDDTLPSSVSLDRSSINVSGLDSSNYELTGSGNIWKIISKGDYALPYGTTIKIEYDAKALKPSNTHLVDNTAITYAFGVDEQQAIAEVWVNSPKFNVSKVADKTKFNLGDTIKYTVEATNVNEGTLAKANFEDVLEYSGVLNRNSIKVMGDGTDITNDCSINVSNNKISIITNHYLKNGNCELSNVREDRRRMGYQYGIAPRSHEKITITYEVNLPSANADDSQAILITDHKTLNNTVKAIPYPVYEDRDIKEDDTIPSGSDEADESLTINNPQLSIKKVSNKEAYKINKTGTYTLSVKQTKPNLIARNVVITDAFTNDSLSGITLNTNSIKVYLNGLDITSLTLISTDNGRFTIITNKSISDQDEIRVTYNVKFNKTGYFSNMASADADNTPQVYDYNQVEVQVNGLPMTGGERNLLFTFIGLGILITISIVVIRRKRRLVTK